MTSLSPITVMMNAKLFFAAAAITVYFPAVCCFVHPSLGRFARDFKYSHVTLLDARGDDFNDWAGIESDSDFGREDKGETDFNMQRLVEQVSLTYGLAGFGGNFEGVLEDENDELGRKPLPEDVYIGKLGVQLHILRLLPLQR